MTQPTDPAALLKALIACRSVTPADDGAQGYLAGVLAGAGFNVERKTFSAAGTPDVDNLFASVGGGQPHLVFAGHTDVVPPGDEVGWSHPPFAAQVADGAIYGRGAVDMKGGIACFVAAALAFLKDRPLTSGTLSLAITGDEEGPAINGTRKLIDWALAGGRRFDAAIVGEPTSRRRLGDTIKIGRRGSLSATIRVAGRQGHVAYPDLADNPIPHLLRILGRLTGLRLDEGSAGFPPSRIEITSVDVGNPAFNIIPGAASARFNVRFNDNWSLAALEDLLSGEIGAAADEAPYDLTIAPGASDWFLTRPGALVDLLSAAIREATGITPGQSTGGGTSDARFFKDVCPVVEFGLVGDTMHQTDERVPIADLAGLTAIYRGFLDRYFAARRP
ncbi:MAG: succinyl-diaminopimelate desuccinylase [Bauldia sp.]